MAEHTDLASLSIEMIDEYLAAACLLLRRRKDDGGIHGYAAALLLMAVVDSLGHAQSRRSKGVDLSVLEQPEFGLGVDGKQRKKNLKRVKQWYRNGLVHTGTMAPNVYLLPEAGGEPFVFDAEGKLKGIRMRVIFRMIEHIWKERRPTYKPVGMEPGAETDLPQPSSPFQEASGSVMSPAPSGFATSQTTPPSGAAVNLLMRTNNRTPTARRRKPSKN